MTPETKKERARFYGALVLFSLIGQIAWVLENMYFNVFIYEMFRAKPEDISLMVAASAVTAALTTLFIGALSDRLGRRKPFICIGYIVWGLSLFAFCLLSPDRMQALAGTPAGGAALGVSLTVIFDCLMTFFGSSANDACFNAWLTDQTTSANRGKAEGINSMMPLLAVLIVFGSFMSFDLKKMSSWTIIFAVIGGVVTLCGLLGFFLVADASPRENGGQNYLKNIIFSFRPSTVKAHGTLYLALLAFSVFGISIQVFMPYLILYYQKGLQMENYVLVMAPAILLAAVVTFFYGRLYDRKGFLFSIVPALGMLAAGYILLFFFKHIVPVFIGSFLMMSGYLCGMAVFGALLRDKTPEGKAGSFQGIRIFGQVLIPGVIGPYIGAFILRDAEKIVNSDGTESFIPNKMIFLGALAVAALLIIPVVFTAIRLKKENVDEKK